jgi:hypothetical protein
MAKVGSLCLEMVNYKGFANITSHGIQLIVQNFPHLTHLILNDCNLVGGAAITAFIASDPHFPSPALPNLVHLTVTDCSITNQGYISLSKSQLLDQLESLNIIYNQVGAEAILKTPLFSYMKTIQIQTLLVLKSTPSRLAILTIARLFSLSNVAPHHFLASSRYSIK